VAEAEGLGSGVACCGTVEVEDSACSGLCKCMTLTKVGTFVDGVDPNHPVLGSSTVSDKNLVGRAKNHDNVVVCDLQGVTCGHMLAGCHGDGT
jgi:hypothetical protein